MHHYAEPDRYGTAIYHGSIEHCRGMTVVVDDCWCRTVDGENCGNYELTGWIGDRVFEIRHSRSTSFTPVTPARSGESL